MPKVIPTYECSPENCGERRVDTCGTYYRYRHGCRCAPCKEASRNRYAENRDAVRAASADRYHANRDVERAKRRANYQANREDRLRKAGEYYERNKDEILSQKRSQTEEQRERINERTRKWLARTGKARVYNAGRRARVVAAFVENVDHAIVFERDNYVCQRCGLQCPKEAKWPAKNSATLDHVVALANGGLHCYDNVQTLCHSCNSAKGNRE